MRIGHLLITTWLPVSDLGAPHGHRRTRAYRPFCLCHLGYVLALICVAVHRCCFASLRAAIGICVYLCLALPRHGLRGSAGHRIDGSIGLQVQIVTGILLAMHYTPHVVCAGVWVLRLV